MFVQDIPFALLRAPTGSIFPSRMCIHVMLEFAEIRQRAQSAGNVLNSQPAAIALSGTSHSEETGDVVLCLPYSADEGSPFGCMRRQSKDAVS